MKIIFHAKPLVSEKKTCHTGVTALLTYVLNMAVPNTPVYQKLLAESERSEIGLAACKDPRDKPRLQRLRVWALARIADELYSDQLHTDSLDYYNQAKKINCDELTVINQIGACLVALDKLPRALYYFELMDRRATAALDEPEVFNRKMKALYNMEQRPFDAVRNDAAEDKVFALYNGAHCYQRMGNHEQVIVNYRKILKLAPYATAANLSKQWQVSEKLSKLLDRNSTKAFRGFMQQTLFGTSVKTQISTDRIENTNKFEI